MISPVKLQEVAEVRSSVDDHLRSVLERRSLTATQLNPDYGRLWDEIGRLMFAGGKRLRPYLTVLAYQAYGGANLAAIVPAAAAQELLHLSLLIHDDIMDRDLTRHGALNVAGAYQAHYSARPDPEHRAASSAILAGDLILALAHHELYTSGFEAERLAAAARVFERAIFEVAGGQLLDMEADVAKGGPEDSLLVARLKTASYSFVGPLHMGATLAGAPATELAKLERLGLALGIGFQLADDMLGIYGEEAVVGKPIISDMREGKPTYIIRLTLDRAEGTEQAWLKTAWGKATATQADLEKVQGIIESTGVKAEVEADMARYGEDAQRLIAGLDIPTSYRDALVSLGERSIWRKR